VGVTIKDVNEFFILWIDVLSMNGCDFFEWLY
jgi:hypothetical protein